MGDLEKINLKGKYGSMDLTIPFGLNLKLTNNILDSNTNIYKGVINNITYSHFLENKYKNKKLTKKRRKDIIKKTKKNQK
tara:strand:- start:51 stop:290 length:240 start_codon:yes stop_codon:yes gene_type:complete